MICIQEFINVQDYINDWLINNTSHMFKVSDANINIALIQYLDGCGQTLFFYIIVS